MFRGASKVSIDAKGRLAIPSRYRDMLLSKSDGSLVATVDRDQCILIYPLQEWDDIQRKLDRLPSFNKAARETQRLMVGYATDIELDGQGRVLISKELREFASLAKHAMLIGQGNKFELWDENSWMLRRDEWLSGNNNEAQLPLEFESLSL
ncbi:MAG: division/cell wall cluster transcriptional repressor MraZ [Pseudomonadota bacterium]|nr:cell division/cell wall cluster transcriptional repressor MraZ [Gammaproteobacteria bacterium]MEE2683781.1 division/cell wall cluster transcriptional repressor MraZ [Pseudomonadota bacterium]|tara:strand:+ start:10831 stop:11283 length:453 start_codon:yes stop_codon:yes gene_type:complete